MVDPSGTVRGVGEETLPRVLAQHPEELALRRDSDFRERTAPELRSGRPAPPAGSPRRARRNVVHGTVQRLQPEAVGLGLVPVGSGQRPIEVRGDPDLLHARTVLVSGEEALEECRGRPSLVEAQGYEWDSSLRLHRVIIHHSMQPFARVNTRCPSSCAIKHESTA